MNKRILFLVYVCLAAIAQAATLTIGNDVFPVALESDVECPSALCDFVADDLTRIFAPLQHVTNIVNIASLREHPGQTQELILREHYPEGFIGAVSMTNDQGNCVFVVEESLVSRYQAIFAEYSSVSNVIKKMDDLVQEIRSGNIANWSNSEKEAFLFIPENCSFHASTELVNQLVASVQVIPPFRMSVLELKREKIGNTFYYTAATMATNVDEMFGLSLLPCEWIYVNQSWKFFFPEFLDMVSGQE